MGRPTRRSRGSTAALRCSARHSADCCGECGGGWVVVLLRNVITRILSALSWRRSIAPVRRKADSGYDSLVHTWDSQPRIHFNFGNHLRSLSNSVRLAHCVFLEFDRRCGPRAAQAGGISAVRAAGTAGLCGAAAAAVRAAPAGADLPQPAGPLMRAGGMPPFAAYGLAFVFCFFSAFFSPYRGL